MTVKSFIIASAIAGLALSAVAPAYAASPAQKATLEKATFAERLGKNQEPIRPTDEFEPTQPVNLSLAFKGRPVGVVTGEFYFHDQLISDAKVDMAKLNAGKSATANQTTYVGFTLTPDKDNPFPISATGYRADVYLDGKPLDSYTFQVVPPAGALTTQLTDDVVLAKGATDDYKPIDPATEFALDEAVYLVGSGDFGQHSWIEARWYEDGELLSEGTRTVTLPEDREGAGFSFFFLPDGGWKAGEHEVVLVVNDEEAGRYPFTVSESAASGSSGEPSAVTVPVDDLETYTHPRKAFVIDAPTNWESSESSEKGEVNTTWVAPDGNGFLFVSVAVAKSGQTLADLGEMGQAYIEREFGGEPEFEMQAPEELSDEIVAISWNAEPEIGGKSLALEAVTFVRQDGDKVSKLTLVLPSDLPSGALSKEIQQIIGSFTVNPSAKF